MFEIKPLTDIPPVRRQLSSLLIDTVANGGSVSFMHPLAPEAADAFWLDALAAAAAGKRLILGAFEGESLIATVTLLLDCPPNQPHQPHRAEIAKLMTAIGHRGQGVARALMIEAEHQAAARGRTLLVLDTATDGGASRLYEGLGYQYAGTIPDYALKPHGGLTGTMLYWKRLVAP